jgi:hypothetical protein
VKISVDFVGSKREVNLYVDLSYSLLQRSKSKSLFDDEDLLFGTPEDAPAVDIFSKSPPPPAKAKAEPAPPVAAKKETKAAAPVKNLFNKDDEEEDLFGTPAPVSIKSQNQF